MEEFCLIFTVKIRGETHCISQNPPEKQNQKERETVVREKFILRIGLCGYRHQKSHNLPSASWKPQEWSGGGNDISLRPDYTFEGLRMSNANVREGEDGCLSSRRE